MKIDIFESDKTNPAINDPDRKITINMSRDGNSWYGISYLTLEDLNDLREAIKKYTNSKKKENGNKSKVRLPKSKRRS